MNCPAGYEHIAHRVICMAHVPPNLSGYRYLVFATAAVAADPSKIHYVTKDLYPETAKYFGKKWTSVERSMRNAIAASWDNGGKEALSLMANHHLAERPSPSLFIAIAAECTAKLYRAMK